MVSVVIVVGVVAAALLLRFSMRRRGRLKMDQTEAKTRKRSAFLAGLLTVVGNIAVVLALLEVAIALGRYFYGLFFSTVPPFAFGSYFFAAAMVYISQICKQQAKRLRTPIAEDALQSDQRPPVLFLRGFSDEEQPLPSYRSWHNLGHVDTLLEDILTEFEEIGPIVGLTNPQLVDRPANYSPYDTKSEYWQVRVQELISRAGVIVLVVSATPSVAWEIQKLKSNNRLSVTLFILRAESSAGDSADSLRWLLGQLQLLPEPDLRVRGEGHPLVALFDGTQIRVFMKTTYDIYHYIHAMRGALQELNDIGRK